MPRNLFFHNTNGLNGQQHPGAWMFFICLVVACHPLPRPGDPRLPEAFRTPERTFATWKQATLDADRERLRTCYWEGLGDGELGAYLNQNLRPEAKGYFQGATLTGVKSVSNVEVNFTFTTPQTGDEIRGVMVKTRSGWKIQHW
jgi:hypothetical protein